MRRAKRQFAHQMEQRIKIALIGAGMFGGDVHLRAYANFQRSGLSPHLGRIGLDHWARDLAPIEFELTAIGARSESSARRACDAFERLTGHQPRPYSGAEPWTDVLRDVPDLDVMAVATPDHLHTPVILAALQRGVHVITEKPMCLSIHEADEIVGLAAAKNLIVSVDMHKRYDPDHLRIRDDIKNRIGEPLYGVAYLEEPLEVSTSTFKWAAQSDPFSYVGPHWVDLIWHYYHSKPVSLTAVGQKKRLAREKIDAYDAVQVRVDYANGMSIHFHNNWITPADFEGPVNQGHEIVGTDGKVESDQQYRGLRYWHKGGGSRTVNTHFTREVPCAGGGNTYVGYGMDSLTASLAAVCRSKFFGATRDNLAPLYPTAEDGRLTVAVVHAAALVRDLNFGYTQRGLGAPVTARFGADGITIIDPRNARVFNRIYGNVI
jgi:predicted dehydrogenase